MTLRLRHRLRGPVGIALRALPLLTGSRRLPEGALRGSAQLLLNRRTAIVPVRYREVPTRYAFRMSGDTRDFIQRYIYVFGVWEPNLSELLVRHLSPGDVVVDVGANVGYFSLLSARCVGRTGRVIAFEPVPEFAAALRTGAGHNGVSDVIELHEIAVSDTHGSTQLYVADASNRGMSSTEQVPGYEMSFSVPMAPADSCVDPAYWSRIRLVKVDVEGDEFRALAGMRRLLEALGEGAVVVAEVVGDRLEARGETVEGVMTFMEDLGFRAFTIPNDYAPRSYAFGRVQGPQPLAGMPPQGHAEVVFIKRERPTSVQPGP